MGLWKDFFLGPELEPQTNTLEARSGDSAPPSDPSTALIIPKRDANKNHVSEGDALGLTAVFRAADIIATSVIQLTLDAYRSDDKIDPRPSLLSRPDPELTRPAFIEQTTLSLVLNGNAFWRIFRDNQGRVTGLRVLNPRDVTIEVDSEGTVTGYKHGHREKPYTKGEVRHLSHMRVPGDARGRGPIQAAQAELRGALDTIEYASHWFTESGVPTGLLSAKMPLNADQAEAAKKRWTETQGGYRGVAVLGGDFTYTPVYLSPEDAQFIQGQQFNTTSVARLFGIPAHMMLAAIEGSSMTYSNVAQADAQYVKYTLSRYLVEIEHAFSEVMPRGTDVRFNIEGLLRPDVVTRYLMHQQALQAGFLSVNEVRDIENLPPAPDSDFKTAEEKAQAFKDAQAAPGPGDMAKPEEESDE